MRRLFRQTLSFLVLLLLLALLWEGAKWLAGDPWRPENNPFGLTHTPPLRWKVTSDLNLPHQRTTTMGSAFRCSHLYLSRSACRFSVW